MIYSLYNQSETNSFTTINVLFQVVIYSYSDLQLALFDLRPLRGVWPSWITVTLDDVSLVDFGTPLSVQYRF